MLQATGIVMGSIFLSRVLGFLREWMVAHRIGSNAETDAYYAAFTLPDFLNYLIAGAALSISFIPVFSKYLAEKREEEGWRVFSTIFTILGLLLIAFVLAAELLAPQLVEIISPGFPAEQKDHVVFLTRLMLPAQICFYLGGLLTAVQYAHGRFLVPALAPLIYNLGIILGGWFLAPRLGAAGFSVGVLAGAFVGNFLLQWWGARQTGLRYRPRFDWRHEGFHRFLKLSLPIMLGFSLVYVDEWLQRVFGSYLESASITWLSYGKALRNIPVGLIGQAAGVASFPFLARLYAEGKQEEMNRLLTGALRAVLFFMLPASALMMVAGKSIVFLVFSSTRLSPADIAATASVLELFALGATAWAAHSILARGFYARGNTWLPTLLGSGVALLSVPLYGWLAAQLRHLGLALASSLAMSVYVALLFALLSYKTKNLHTRATLVFFLKVMTLSVILGLVGKVLLNFVEARIPWNTYAGSLAAIGVVGVAGLLLLPLLAKLFRIEEAKLYLRKVTSLFSQPDSD